MLSLNVSPLPLQNIRVPCFAALRSAPFSSMSSAPEGDGETQMLSVTKGQITQLGSPVEAAQLQPKSSTSRPSTPVDNPGEKSGALKRKGEKNLYGP